MARKPVAGERAWALIGCSRSRPVGIAASMGMDDGDPMFEHSQSELAMTLSIGSSVPSSDVFELKKDLVDVPVDGTGSDAARAWPLILIGANGGAFALIMPMLIQVLLTAGDEYRNERDAKDPGAVVNPYVVTGSRSGSTLLLWLRWLRKGRSEKSRVL